MFRNKTYRVLLAAAAAGVTITTLGFAAASPAGAAGRGMPFTPSAPQVATSVHGNGLAGDLNNCGSSTAAIITGTWSSTDCGKAGYVATGRNFRFASALITVPNHTAMSPRTRRCTWHSTPRGRTWTSPGPASGPALRTRPSSGKKVVRNALPAVTCPVGDTSGWEAFVMVDESGVATVGDVTISPVGRG